MQNPLLTIEQAVECLRAGHVIAYPTEAVYGLGCDPANEEAVRKILLLKNRGDGAGLILIADIFERFSLYAGCVEPEQLSAAQATWPGPVTWLFPCAPGVPDLLTGQHQTIALRVTAHPVCRALCAAFGGAIVSTSANPSSAPPAVSPQAVDDYFAGGIAGTVAGALGGRDRPSEIRELATGRAVRV